MAKTKFDQQSAFDAIIGHNNTNVDNKRSKKDKSEEKRGVNFYLNSKDYEDLQKIAYINRTNVSQIIRDFIADYVNKHGEELAEYERLKPNG